MNKALFKFISLLFILNSGCGVGNSKQQELITEIRQCLQQQSGCASIEVKTWEKYKQVYITFTFSDCKTDCDSTLARQCIEKAGKSVKGMHEMDEILVLQFQDKAGKYNAYTFRHCLPYLDFQF